MRTPSNNRRSTSKLDFFVDHALLMLLGLGLVFALTGCASTSALPTPQPGQTVQPSLQATGSWFYTEKGVSFSADVTSEMITVNLDLSGSKGLYWMGNFSKPQSTPVEIVSAANTNQLRASLYGSNATSKTFTFKDDHLSFQFEMMGVTKTVVLSRVN